MTLLDKLQALKASATPAPWYGDERYLIGSPKWGRTPVRNHRGGETIGQMGYNDETTPEERIADAKLAALSPFIPKLVAALDGLLAAESVEQDFDAGVMARFHLKELEEALDAV